MNACFSIQFSFPTSACVRYVQASSVPLQFYEVEWSAMFWNVPALGPLLPQMNVFGRQLGVSPAVMGGVTAVLPILWALAKPAMGYIVDYFQVSSYLFIYLLSISNHCATIDVAVAVKEKVPLNPDLPFSFGPVRLIRLKKVLESFRAGLMMS